MTDDGENAFGYGELPNVSMLAGAAWRCGYIALQEFAWDKNKENGRSGRADLYLCSSDYTQEYIEAKFDWLSLQSRNPKSVIEKTTRKALNDAIKTKQKRRHIKTVAVSFIAIYTKLTKYGEIYETLEEQINTIWQMPINGRKPDLLTWNFPEKLWQEDNRDPDTKDLTLGVLMLAQHTKETDTETEI
ncbi:hypothetical protein [Leucothrix pacifica]|uniref:Uncharacterized protein n=1 Tax=Leucothrix pacifica TaxID=1247513 RepID=A0A317C8T8_9GAMM|nr:hypothetical protein [Leucothrix pacifica]PWQ92740.1 hypothetical protein DKW60_19685 [Leucothrix pacifica]